MKKIKCSECKKEYDYTLKSCPHCGYENKIKKIVNVVLYAVSIILFIISVFKCLDLFYTTKVTNDVTEFLQEIDMEQESKLFKMAVECMGTKEFINMYGSETYGKVAYTLNNLKICSMSLCIAVIWFGIYLQNKNIKFGKLVKYIAIVVFIICQLVPLIYTIYLTKIII